MTQTTLDLQMADDTHFIEETIKDIQSRLDHVPANENDIWNAIHNYLRFYVSQKPTESEYNKITSNLEIYIKENIL